MHRHGKSFRGTSTEWTCDQLDGESGEFFAQTPYLLRDEEDSLLCTHAEVIDENHSLRPTFDR